MNNHAPDVVRLVELLCQQSGATSIRWKRLSESVDDRPGGWRIEWQDGPTASEMRDSAVRLASKELTGFDVKVLLFDRQMSMHTMAIALLLHLDQTPNAATVASRTMKHRVAKRASYPERAEQIWQDRAHKVVAMEDEFYARLRHAAGGWAPTLQWLDDLADNLCVTSLAEYRIRRNKADVVALLGLFHS